MGKYKLMAKKNYVFVNSISYIIGNLLLKACSFFLIPLYTSFLTTEDYGITNLASGFYNLLAFIVTLSLHYSVGRFYADCKNDKKQVSVLLGTIITFIIFVSTVVLGLSFLFKNQLSKYLFESLPFFPVILMSVSIAITSGIYNIYQDILKSMERATLSIILSYVYFGLNLGSNIVTVVVLKLGANGVLLSTVVVNLIMIIIMFVDLFHNKLLKLGVDFKVLKELLKYSLPLMPHTLSFSVSSYMTKLIITGTLSLSSLGIFSLSNQFSSVSDIVANSTQSAYIPWMYGQMNLDNENSRKGIARTGYILIWLCGFLYIAIALFAEEAIIIMAADEFREAWMYVPLSVAVFSLKIPSYYFNNFLYYNKNKTKFVFVSTVVGSSVNILMTWWLVPMLALYGSILADLAAMIVMSVVTLAFSYKDAVKIFSLKKIFVLPIVQIAFITVGIIPSFIFFSGIFSFVNVAYKFLIIFLYVAVFMLVNKLSPKNMIKSIRKNKT